MKLGMIVRQSLYLLISYYK